MRNTLPQVMAVSVLAVLMAAALVIEPKGGPREVRDGLANVPEGWWTYESVDGQWQIAYPPTWTLTETESEIQWWDTIGEDNAVKVVVFEVEGGELDRVEEEAVVETAGMSYERVELNGIHTLIRSESGLGGETQTYFYQMEGEVIGVAAYFYNEDPVVREQAGWMQESLTLLKE